MAKREDGTGVYKSLRGQEIGVITRGSLVEGLEMKLDARQNFWRISNPVLLCRAKLALIAVPNRSIERLSEY